MKFNHSKLLGKIKEAGMSQEELAKKVGITKTTMNLKLNSNAFFTSKEIAVIMDVLDIPAKDVASYFFS